MKRKYAKGVDELTTEKLKEAGEYLGFSKELGYVYRLNEKVYSYSAKGIVNITHLDVAL